MITKGFSTNVINQKVFVVQLDFNYVVYIHVALKLAPFTGRAHLVHYLSGAQTTDSTVLLCYCRCASPLLTLNKSTALVIYAPIFPDSISLLGYPRPFRPECIPLISLMRSSITHRRQRVHGFLSKAVAPLTSYAWHVTLMTWRASTCQHVQGLL